MISASATFQYIYSSTRPFQTTINSAEMVQDPEITVDRFRLYKFPKWRRTDSLVSSTVKSC